MLVVSNLTKREVIKMLVKYIKTAALATALAAGSLATAQGLNPFQEVPPGQAPNAIGAGACYDYYPVFLGGYSGYESILALACVTDGGCVFDICAVPAGDTVLSCSYNNVWDPRELRFLTASNAQLGLLRGTYGQVYVFDGSDAGTTVAASRHYVFSGDSFSIEMPESNCTF